MDQIIRASLSPPVVKKQNMCTWVGCVISRCVLWSIIERIISSLCHGHLLVWTYSLKALSRPSPIALACFRNRGPAAALMWSHGVGQRGLETSLAPAYHCRHRSDSLTELSDAQKVKSESMKYIFVDLLWLQFVEHLPGCPETGLRSEEVTQLQEVAGWRLEARSILGLRSGCPYRRANPSISSKSEEF